VVADTVNDMAARIEKQLADQRELLAAVSHELRTPLARIRLLTEMARGGGAGPRLLDDLDREVVEIDALVGDLLASSRLDFNAITPSRLAPAEVALRALERAGLDPTLLEVDEDVPASFEADATLLARALANLLANARAHGGGASRLRVRQAQAPQGIAFEVEDEGPGFAEGDEARAFAPFYRREHEGRGAERGSLGLGLALCKRIAEAHGGRAYAENREGGGARVGVEIALSPPQRAGAAGEPSGG
jgi:signal transduction histidine kinase